MRAISLADATTRQRIRTSSGRLLFLIAVSGLGTLGLVVLAALWAGAESDAAALERQRQLMTARLREQVEQVAQVIGQIGAGYTSSTPRDRGGDAPSSQPSRGPATAERPGAVAALTIANLATSVFGYDQAFVVDDAGLLVMQTDPEAEKRYRWMKPLLQPLLRDLRPSAPEPSAPDGDRIGPSAAASAGRDPAKGAIATLMRLEGRPTIVGVVSIGDPDGPIGSDGSQPSAGERYLIAIRFLDGAVLDDLSREQGLNGARFARSADPEQSEVAFQVDATATGEPIGFIVWSPDLPGSRVIGRLVPALSVAALVIAILFSTLLVRLRRSLAELRMSEHQARHLALHDVLTELPNRALFAERFEESILETAGERQRTAVALIDLDRFKAVNDTFGHAAGDELIRMAADRMRTVLRPQDTLARLGGDEFALLIRDIGESDAMVADVCSGLLAQLGQPFRLCNGEAVAHVGGSIGLAVVPDVGRSAGDVMHYADVALYEAKTGGRGRWTMFTQSMDGGRNAREALKNELRAVLDRAAGSAGDLPDACPMTAPPDFGTLEVHFQTVHRALKGYAVSGAEALVRWRHSERGLLAPNSFIPVAEESGLIDALGFWVLREACRVASTWPPDTFVAVNVSPHQLRKPNFADAVLAVLRETGMAPSRLELELTESALIDDDRDTEAALARLRAEGIQISLDDFGTGFSSLSHLIRFGIDRIKIDRSFVQLLGTKANGAAIVAAIVSLGRNLGIATTAEGIETEAQRDFLVALGCSDLQGYIFSKPAPVCELAQFTRLQAHEAGSALGERDAVA